MANTVTINIEVTGSAADQIEKIRSAADTGFKGAGESAKGAESEFTKLGESLKDVAGSVPGLSGAFTQFGTALEAIGAKAKDGQDQIALIGSGVAALGIGIAGLSFEAFDHGVESLHLLSEQTGLTIEQVGGFQLALKEAGLSSDSATSSLDRFQMNLQRVDQEMTQGKAATGPFAEALTQIGVSATGANGQVQSMGDLIPQIADRFKAMKEEADATGTTFNATGVAMELFGRQGAAMVPILEQGSEALTTAQKDFLQFGMGTEAQVANLERWNEASAKAQGAVLGLAAAIGSDVSPMLTTVANVVAGAVTAFDQLPGPIKDLVVTLPLVGGGALAAAAGIGAIVGIATSGVGAITAAAGALSSLAATEIPVGTNSAGVAAAAAAAEAVAATAPGVEAAAVAEDHYAMAEAAAGGVAPAAAAGIAGAGAAAAETATATEAAGGAALTLGGVLSGLGLVVGTLATAVSANSREFQNDAEIKKNSSGITEQLAILVSNLTLGFVNLAPSTHEAASGIQEVSKEAADFNAQAAKIPGTLANMSIGFQNTGTVATAAAADIKTAISGVNEVLKQFSDAIVRIGPDFIQTTTGLMGNAFKGVGEVMKTAETNTRGLADAQNQLGQESAKNAGTVVTALQGLIGAYESGDPKAIQFWQDQVTGAKSAAAATDTATQTMRTNILGVASTQNEMAVAQIAGNSGVAQSLQGLIGAYESGDPKAIAFWQFQSSLAKDTQQGIDQTTNAIRENTLGLASAQVELTNATIQGDTGVVSALNNLIAAYEAGDPKAIKFWTDQVTLAKDTQSQVDAATSAMYQKEEGLATAQNDLQQATIKGQTGVVAALQGLVAAFESGDPKAIAFWQHQTTMAKDAQAQYDQTVQAWITDDNAWQSAHASTIADQKTLDNSLYELDRSLGQSTFQAHIQVNADTLANDLQARNTRLGYIQGDFTAYQTALQNKLAVDREYVDQSNAVDVQQHNDRVKATGDEVTRTHDLLNQSLQNYKDINSAITADVKTGLDQQAQATQQQMEKLHLLRTQDVQDDLDAENRKLDAAVHSITERMRNESDAAKAIDAGAVAQIQALKASLDQQVTLEDQYKNRVIQDKIDEEQAAASLKTAETKLSIDLTNAELQARLSADKQITASAGASAQNRIGLAVTAANAEATAAGQTGDLWQNAYIKADLAAIKFYSDKQAAAQLAGATDQQAASDAATAAGKIQTQIGDISQKAQDAINAIPTVAGVATAAVVGIADAGLTAIGSGGGAALGTNGIGGGAGGGSAGGGALTGGWGSIYGPNGGLGTLAANAASQAYSPPQSTFGVSFGQPFSTAAASATQAAAALGGVTQAAVTNMITLGRWDGSIHNAVASVGVFAESAATAAAITAQAAAVVQQGSSFVSADLLTYAQNLAQQASQNGNSVNYQSYLNNQAALIAQAQAAQEALPQGVTLVDGLPTINGKLAQNVGGAYIPYGGQMGGGGMGQIAALAVQVIAHIASTSMQGSQQALNLSGSLV